jgi:hypothetical protein
MSEPADCYIIRYPASIFFALSKREMPVPNAIMEEFDPPIRDIP